MELKPTHSPSNVEIAAVMLEHRETIVYAKITLRHIGIFDGFLGFEGIVAWISMMTLCRT